MKKIVKETQIVQTCKKRMDQRHYTRIGLMKERSLETRPIQREIRPMLRIQPRCHKAQNTEEGENI